MLKKFRSTDIDTIMNLWKKEFLFNNKKIENSLLTQKYTDIRDKLLDKNSTTILYTEDDIIEGFISINGDAQIFLIYVDRKIRREGIGSMLVDSCKKKYKKLSTLIESKNQVSKQFFEKNEFKKVDDENTHGKEKYEWSNEKEEYTTLIYFDNDIDEKMSNNDSKIKFKKVELEKILSGKDIKDVKVYVKVRKVIEQAFKSPKVLLYLNYNNYNPQIDEIIKEIAKVEKVKFAIIVGEPLIIEKYKTADIVQSIEESYKNYKIYKVDTETKLKKDVSINRIFDEKMKIILDNIGKIAEKM